MSEALTVTFKLPTRRPRPEPASTAPGSPGAASDTPASTPAPFVSRTARQLALAHHIERLVDRGDLTHFAEAARLLGVSRARVAQVTGLLSLSARLQEAIFLGELCASERTLRRVVQEPIWDRQLALVEAMVIRRGPRAATSIGR